MDIAVTSSSGAKSGSVQLSDSAFALEFKEPLVHQVVTAYMAGGRAGTRAQKTRSQVRGGGSKPWRQKGTGRARAGSIRSPLWRGGGKVFAAVPRDYSQKVNKKMYRGALRSIVSELIRQDRLIVLDQLSVAEPRTKALLAILKTLGTDNALLVTSGIDRNLFLASRNLPNVELRDVAEIDPVSLVRYEKTLMTVEAVKQLEEQLA